MPSITFQEWADIVKVRADDVDAVAITAVVGFSGQEATVLCTPNEARKLATMLNEIADRVEDDS